MKPKDLKRSSMLSKTCYVYGDETFYEKFQVEIHVFIAEQDESYVKESNLIN